MISKHSSIPVPSSCRRAFKNLFYFSIFDMYFILQHHHRRHVVRVDSWAARWPLASSDLQSIDSSRALASSWTLLSQTMRGRPGCLLLLTIGFLPSYVSTIRCRAWCAGTLGSRHATWRNRDKRRWRKMSPMVDKPDHWSTSGLQTWAHQHTSSICH